MSAARSSATRSASRQPGALVLAALLGACGAGSTGSHALAGGPLAGAVAAGFGSLDVFAQGAHVQLLYVVNPEEKGPGELFHTRSTDGGETWSAPVRVDAGLAPPNAASTTNAPQIAAEGERLVAIWSTAGTGFMGRGPLVVALSSDAGRTWRSAPAPAPIAAGGAQAFIDVAIDPRGAFHAVWLADTGAPEVKGLYHARSADGGASWSEPTLVDPEMCQCCWNEALASDDGELYVLYRDVGPRDMGVARLGAQGWSLLGLAGAFGWQMEACPHVGGALAVSGAAGARALHTLVWTGKENEIGLYYVRSRDGGASWDEPRRMGTSDATRADLVRSGDGTLLALWDSWANVTWGSISHDGGERWSEPVALSPEGVSTRYPLAAIALGQDFRVFWTEEEQDGARLASRLVRANEL